jgi:serine/threonine protein phosphatase PrpC
MNCATTYVSLICLSIVMLVSVPLEPSFGRHGITKAWSRVFLAQKGAFGLRGVGVLAGLGWSFSKYAGTYPVKLSTGGDIQHTKDETSIAHVPSKAAEPEAQKKSNACVWKWNVDAGVYGLQGDRSAMEDAHNCDINSKEQKAFFGIYDGHGGKDVAGYAAQHLPEKLCVPGVTLSQAVVALGQEVLTQNALRAQGSCLVAAYLCGVKLDIAWLGDSRLLHLRPQGNELCVIFETKDHHPGDERELAYIEQCGGTVKWSTVSRSFRLQGANGDSLEMSRALGDRETVGKQGQHLINYNPDTHQTSIAPGDMLVMFCDGVSEGLRNSQVVSLIQKLHGHKRSAQAMARELVDDAYRQGSGDNITALVARFDAT